MAKLDLFSLDRDLAKVYPKLLAWQRLVRRSPAAAEQSDPFSSARYVSTRDTFVNLLELDPTTPQRAGLLAWVFRMCIARIATPYRLRAAFAFHSPSLEVNRPVAGVYSPRALFHLALSEKHLSRSQAWFEHFASACERTSRAVRDCADAEQEIASRLGAPPSLELESPIARASLQEAAHLTLRGTRELLEAGPYAASDAAGRIACWISRDVRGSWPRQVSSAFLQDLFPDGELTRGLSLQLGELPASLGASSFLRGLARFGAAYARAVVPPPFASVADPHELFPMRRGALFGSLLLDDQFLVRKLGFSRDEAAEGRRTLVTAWVAQVRVDAARSLCGPGASALTDTMSEAVGTVLTGSLAGVFPRVSPHSAARFAGALLALRDARGLRERFDEDWFRNPHALRALREEDGSRTDSRVSSDVLQGHVASFIEWAEHASH